MKKRMNGLLDDDYRELVIREGIPCREEMVWDFRCYYRRFMNADEIYEQENKGLLQSGNASSSAEDLADIFLHVMGNRGVGVDEVMMVAIRCNVGCSDGRIAYNTVVIFPIMEETCREIRQKQEESRTLIIEKGTALTGKERVAIPMIDRELQNIPISEFDADALASTHSSRKVKEEMWGFTDAAESGAYLG